MFVRSSRFASLTGVVTGLLVSDTLCALPSCVEMCVISVGCPLFCVAMSAGFTVDGSLFLTVVLVGDSCGVGDPRGVGVTRRGAM